MAKRVETRMTAAETDAVWVQYKAGATCATIAVTALASALPIYTCNPDDFSGIAGLEVIAVPVPTH